MSLKNPYQAYQTQSVVTSRTEDLTYLLYQGLIKFIRLSKVALEQNNIEESNRNNLRAQDILTELMVTLKPGFEISQPMMTLYDFMKSRLISANIEKNIAFLEEVEGLAEDMAETWKQATDRN
ncbi:flagellar export chaperone FliS [Bacillus sp. B-jedd]|uniref:flagellar export chaperone FliS n=1 Tax=Bacillus sp. B-jedd TaxID=1476857 RepID=UPI0005156140|nr:flagellar export chaperone FliS [Bacillus sp. B-jedd]CEG25909.1 flagellar assembly protein FliS [Bacillus sp. B-jedd]